MSERTAYDWIDDIERMQGGPNGPTIKLRAAIAAMGEPVSATLEQFDEPAFTAQQTDVRRFMAVASKPHAAIAGTLADEIKAAIFQYEGQIPLALAIGVLRIVEKELLDAA
jgi:hypothetical protein